MTTGIQRTPLHRRNIDVQGYLRSDGLWDIEAVLIDTKSYEMDLIDKGIIAVGESLHQMILTMTVDDDLNIVDMRAQMQATPYQDCPGAARQYAALIGLKIKSGWMDTAKRAIGRATGCTHLTELLPVLATAAIQTIRGYKMHNEPGYTNGEQERKGMTNSCYGYRDNGRAQNLLWPDESSAE